MLQLPKRAPLLFRCGPLLVLGSSVLFYTTFPNAISIGILDIMMIFNVCMWFNNIVSPWFQEVDNASEQRSYLDANRDDELMLTEWISSANWILVFSFPSWVGGVFSLWKLEEGAWWRVHPELCVFTHAMTAVLVFSAGLMYYHVGILKGWWRSLSSSSSSSSYYTSVIEKAIN